MEITDKVEQPVSSELPSQGDRVTATLYRAGFALERDREMTSGMMYRPSADRVVGAVKELLNCGAARESLSDEERGAVEQQLNAVFSSMDEFNNERLRVGYSTSYPETPNREMSANEICRFRSPYEKGPEPSAVVYLTGDGKLSYRMTADDALRSKVADMSDKSAGIESGVLTQVKSLAPEVITKLAQVFTSDSFSKKWDELEAGLRYEPKKPLSQVVDLEAVK